MKVLGCEQRLATRMLETVAEASCRAQALNWNAVLQYILCMQRAKRLRTVAGSWRVSYDETPMSCQMTFCRDQAPTLELCKLYVVETTWSLLIATECDDDSAVGVAPYLILHGHFSPALRVSDAGTAEAVAVVLKDVHEQQQAPQPEDIAALGCPFFRIAETDAAPCNSRAERLWSNYSPLPLLWLPCLCHRVHKIAEKVWSLAPGLLTSLTRVLLVLRSSSNMCRLMDRLRAEIKKRCRRLPPEHMLTNNAKRFRHNALSLWSPPEHQAKRTALVRCVCECLMNGDWTQHETLDHVCHGCCADAAETEAKMMAYLPRLFTSLRGSGLCKANWVEWSAPLGCLGLLTSMHGLLPVLFRSSFQKDMGQDRLYAGSCSFCHLDFQKKTMLRQM